MKKRILTLVLACTIIATCAQADQDNAVIPVPNTPENITQKHPSFEKRFREATQSGEISKFQDILREPATEQKLIHNCVRCKDVTRTIIYKTMCYAAKKGNTQLVQELLAQENIVKAFNEKTLATTFDQVKIDTLAKAIIKHDAIDLATLLIEKTTYKDRLVYVLGLTDAKLKITQNMKTLVKKDDAPIAEVSTQNQQ